MLLTKLQKRTGTAGQLEEAQKLFELALKHYPNFEQAHLGLGAVLASLQKPQEALPHLQKAVQLNDQNEVSWYRLSQVQGMLGNTVERQKAFAEFQRLRTQKSRQEEAGKQISSPEEVTKQTIDAKDAAPLIAPGSRAGFGRKKACVQQIQPLNLWQIESGAGYNSSTFFHGHQLVHGDFRDSLPFAIRPAHTKLCRRGRSESEMEPEVITG